MRNCTTAEVFVDTNVLLYTIDEDPASATKRLRAQQLLLSERWGWSVQVHCYLSFSPRRGRGPIAQGNALGLRCKTWLHPEGVRQVATRFAIGPHPFRVHSPRG